MLNYHELTMNEPQNSAAKRKQFLIISTIMASLFVYHALNAGVFYTLTIETGNNTNSTTAVNGAVFPGGEFIYKLMKKDYAASGGTLRTIRGDLGLDDDNSKKEYPETFAEDMKEVDGVDLLYSVFMDDEWKVPGGAARFAGGLLLSSSSSSSSTSANLSSKFNKEMKSRLLIQANDAIDAENTSNAGGKAEEEFGGGGEGMHSKHVKYQVGTLPRVAAAVAQHPFTDGAFSAILLSYKIIPAFRKYAKENNIESGENSVVISTCSAKQQMCTFYMPLAKRETFYLGNPNAETYAASFTEMTLNQKIGVDLSFLSKLKGGGTIGGVNLGKVWRGLKKVVGLGGTKKSDGGSGSEL